MTAAKKIIVAITGASGSPYASRLVELLLSLGHEVHMVASADGKEVFKHETQVDFETFISKMKNTYSNALFEYDNTNFFSSIASGSFQTDGMVIVPCSMSTVGNVANCTSKNLIGRAADVCLKERRPLVMVVRETPFNSIHLKNMLTLSDTGAIILPAMPAFYNMPQSMEDIINFICGRILDSLRIENTIYPRWTEC